MKQIYGKKKGMSRTFLQNGECIAVTLIECEPNVVCQVKTPETDGYSAMQVGFTAAKSQRLTKPLAGHFAKAQQGTFKHLHELRVDGKNAELKAVGESVTVDGLFENGTLIDVTGVTQGKGFAGVIKRHGMKGFPMTRGTHEVRRHGGSIGNRKFPGRVFKNKRMPGHMGNLTVTQQALEVIETIPQDNLLVVKGSIPGPKNTIVYIRESIKA
jgi:large subunit ribosomal protein L3